MDIDKYYEQILEKIERIDEKNDALVVDKEVRKFMALRDKRSKKENIKILKRLIKKHAEAIENTSEEFYKIVNKALPKKGVSPHEIEFLHQIKSMSSIIDKVIDRGTKLSQLGDIVRGAILFKDTEKMEDFISDFRRKYSKYITDYEYKKKGSDPTYGYYGSHHLDLYINGMDVELQILPDKLWKYKEAAHGIYTKWRSKPGDVDAFDANLSKKLFNIGNLTETVEIDGELFEYCRIFVD